MLQNLFRLFNNLSLNVVLATAVCSAMFARLPDGDGKIEVSVLIALSVATWLIYLLDRLLDLKIYPPEKSRRHWFHHQNKSKIKWLLGVLLLVGFILLFFLPYEVLLFGLVLSLLIALYLFILNKLLKGEKSQWLKEPMTAIFYTMAVCGPQLVLMPVITSSTYVLVFFFFVVVSQNLLLFSYFEYLLDEESINTVSHFGKKRSEVLIRACFTVLLVLALVLFANSDGYRAVVAYLLLAMSLILSLMPVFKIQLIRHESYRWVGDGVFLLSALSFLF